MDVTRGQFTAAVAANVRLCREHYRLMLHLDAFPPTVPGQFVQVLCRDLTDAAPLLRRPFSLAGRRDTDRGVELDLIHRTVGVGTDWLANLAVGQAVSIIGPLGNGFTRADGVALLVGGGVGIPPMLYLAAQWGGRHTVAFAGATTRDQLPLTITTDAPPPAHAGDVDPLFNVAEFAAHGVPAVVATDDGSYGYRGFVTGALEQYLDRWLADVRPTIYTCGPEPMMKRVAAVAAARNVPCQVAVERAMACGLGTCQSCCIRVRKRDPAAAPMAGSPWCYRLACTDGPVFAGADLLW